MISKLIEERARPTVEPLLALSDDELFSELGRRAESISRDPADAGNMEMPKFRPEGISEGLRDLGMRIFSRVNREMHALVCGETSEDQEDRKSVLEAAGIGDAALASVLTGILVSSFGLAPALAGVAAALLVKRVFAPAGQEVCAYWGEQLD